MLVRGPVEGRLSLLGVFYATAAPSLPKTSSSPLSRRVRSDWDIHSSLHEATVFPVSGQALLLLALTRTLPFCLF